MCVTYEVVLHAQSPGAFLLQQTLQQVPPRVGHVGLQHGRLVQDVVVHLRRVAAVERRLREGGGDRTGDLAFTFFCGGFTGH